MTNLTEDSVRALGEEILAHKANTGEKIALWPTSLEAHRDSWKQASTSRLAALLELLMESPTPLAMVAIHTLRNELASRAPFDTADINGWP